MTMRYLTYLQYRFSHLVAATTNNVRTAIYIYIPLTRLPKDSADILF